ncbi:LAQU0S01e09296g1_1 [Lachancea quebecensis]|uniref:4a-hydroxytetrahydrobiopterin dehydratase n=1 Tax=Lachancea quebecensis TaxID=1654605 RepID=A0A0P1KPD2_9SACH|nr:LAQU0S01e09296g1_1 [Lachancea quebecensis]
MYNKVKRVSALPLSAADISRYLVKHPKWSYDGLRISRDVAFKDFETTWSFLGQVAMRSHLWGHHPMITTTYNKVNLKLTTHDVNGVSDIDIKLMERIEGYIAGHEEASA